MTVAQLLERLLAELAEPRPTHSFVASVEAVCAEPLGVYAAIDAISSRPSPVAERTLAFVAASRPEDNDSLFLLGYLLWLPPNPDRSTVLNLLTALQRASANTSPFIALCGARVAIQLESALIHVEEAVREAALDTIETLLQTGALLRAMSSAAAKSLATKIAEHNWSQAYDEDAARIVRTLKRRARDFAVNLELPPMPPKVAVDGAWGASIKRGRNLVASFVKQARRVTELAAYATEQNSVGQVLRLSGRSVASKGAPFRLLTHMLQGWERLLAAEATKGASWMDGFRFLRTVEGSLCIELAATESLAPLMRQASERVGQLASSSGPESLVELIPIATMRSTLLDMVEQLVDGDVSLEVINVEPKGERPFSREILSRESATRVNDWAHTTPQRHVSTVEVAAILEGANLRKGTFSIAALGNPDPLSGKFSNRRLLRGKVIGQTYLFSLRTSEWHDIRRGHQAEWELEGVGAVARTAGDETPFEHQQEFVDSLSQLTGNAIPQKEDFDKIIQAVLTVVEEKELKPEEFGYEQPRSVHYLTHAAKVLGLLTPGGNATSAGQNLARLASSSRYGFLACQFEASAVGVAWRNWSEVASIKEVDPSTALDFLSASVTGLSDATLKRRAQTLTRWWNRLFGPRSLPKHQSNKR